MCGINFEGRMFVKIVYEVDKWYSSIITRVCIIIDSFPGVTILPYSKWNE
jgi:hypothetical protein